MPLPDLMLTSLDGTNRRLADFAGKALLVVNVASRCGFTPQYAGLEALHRRWVTFLRALPAETFARTFQHPEWGLVSIDGAIALYEWHCRHHLAHIEQGLAARV